MVYPGCHLEFVLGPLLVLQFLLFVSSMGGRIAWMSLMLGGCFVVAYVVYIWFRRLSIGTNAFHLACRRDV